LLLEQQNEILQIGTRSPGADTSLSNTTTKENFVIAEVGCGVGNSILPMIEQIYRHNGETNRKGQFHFIATDFSPVALNILREDRRYIKAPACGVKVDTAVWDITLTNSIPTCVNGAVDITLVKC